MGGQAQNGGLQPATIGIAALLVLLGAGNTYSRYCTMVGIAGIGIAAMPNSNSECSCRDQTLKEILNFALLNNDIITALVTSMHDAQGWNVMATS